MKQPVFLLSLLFFTALNSLAQQTLTFLAADSVEVTADFYRSERTTDPYILFFHQAGSCRGEYLEIAPKLRKLGYNCLAVDLRYGDSEGFLKNETALAAKSLGLNPQPVDSKADILAAINFAYNRIHKPLILFGSSYSASLCLMIAAHEPKVEAVIAFSPGEFFEPGISVKNEIAGLSKPAFIASTRPEIPYVKELTQHLNSDQITLISPKKGNGVHGAKALWMTSESSDEYWLSLMLFFRQLNDDYTNR
jgi:pimeloyl-ACP methyl ester carboxylesterase